MRYTEDEAIGIAERSMTLRQHHRDWSFFYLCLGSYPLRGGDFQDMARERSIEARKLAEWLMGLK